MRNKGFWFLFILNVALFGLDMYYTMRLSELLPFFELNPLFRWGGWAPVVLLNLVVFTAIVYFYLRVKTGGSSRFLLIHALVIYALARVVAIKNALHWINNPVSVEVAAQVGTEAARQVALVQMSLTVYAPVVVCLLTYFFWRLDHDIARRDV